MQNIGSDPPVLESLRLDRNIAPQAVQSILQQDFRMLLDHFGLREDPFGSTPDPRFLYLTARHREALASLETGIHYNHGFLLLVAPPGLGKTTLLYHMLEKYKTSRKANTAFVFQTQCNPPELIRQVITDFGLTAVNRDLVQMHQQLNEFLAREVNSGKQVILFIDEAHNLHSDVLETVRLLSNFETPRSKLLQIVLAGQPLLCAKLADSRALQLTQRVFTTIRLEPMSPDETEGYIDHRLSVSGHNGNGLFTKAARAIIVRHSQGVPRVINSICFGCFALGYTLKVKTIDDSIAKRVVQDFADCTWSPAWSFDLLRAESDEDEWRLISREDERAVISSPANQQTPAPSHPLGVTTTVHDSPIRPVPPLPESPQLIRSVRVRASVPIKQLPAVLRAIHAAESELEGRGCVNVQYADSGRLARVTIEGQSDEVAKRHINAITRVLKSSIGA